MITVPEDIQHFVRIRARSLPHEEICGLIYDGRFIVLENKSTYPERSFFVEELPKFEHPVTAFVHSHPKGGSAIPSKSDWMFAWNSGLPQVLYLYDEDIFVQYNAGIYSGTLIGRPFRMGVTDCFSLVRDGLKLLFNVDIQDYPRWWGYWDEVNLIGNYLATNSFIHRVPELQPGAVVVSKIGRTTFANHLSLVLEDGTLLDHRSHHEGYSPHMLSRHVKDTKYILDHMLGIYAQ